MLLLSSPCSALQEARELREKLNGLKELVAEHGDGPETDMLREQLADAESRLESVFERQRQEEENLVSTTSAFSGVHYRLRHRQAEQLPEVTSKVNAQAGHPCLCCALAIPDLWCPSAVQSLVP